MKEEEGMRACKEEMELFISACVSLRVRERESERERVRERERESEKVRELPRMWQISNTDRVFFFNHDFLDPFPDP